MSSTPMTSSFSSEAYFETQTAPSTVDAERRRVRDFVRKHMDAGRRIVLVTSGGTTVPLELNVVRFLDNFSAGTRGATSAEYFLKAGYAVIFMHRQFSLQPFSRHYSHSTNPFLDLLIVNPEASEAQNQCSAVPTIAIVPEARDQLLSVLTAYRGCHVNETLLTLTFVTINDYLWLLRAVSEEMATMGRTAMYYLAAAVSDFFLPTQKMSEHKIQSGKGSLNIEMDQVPKILKPMISEWTPGGFVVSFKLETDSALLIPKAQRALARYGHQVVIGNQLHRRKFEVVFVSPKPGAVLSDPVIPGADANMVDDEREGSETGTARKDLAPSSKPHAQAHPIPATSQFDEQWLNLFPEDVDKGQEIELEIVNRLVEMHSAWIRDAPTVALPSQENATGSVS